MSFQLINPVDGSIVANFKSGEQFTLDADRTVIIDTLCTAIIRHNVYIKTKGLVWIVRKPGVFLTQTLIVDSGPVDDGEVLTYVFNFGAERIHMGKGEAVSRLVAL